MDLKRALGLALCAAALALAGWGLFAARTSARKPPPAPAFVTPPPPVDVYIYHDGGLRVGDKPSSLEALPADIATAAFSPDKTLQGVKLHEEVTVDYDVHTAVFDRVTRAGWTRLDLDTVREGQLPRETRAPQPVR